MRCLFLLYGDEAGEAALSPEERRAIVEGHAALGKELAARGTLVTGEALEGRAAARVVRRRRSGGDLVMDGPFAETKEQLGAFYVLECADLDEAIALAGRFPDSPGLIVEVRPVAAM